MINGTGGHAMKKETLTIDLRDQTLSPLSALGYLREIAQLSLPPRSSGDPVADASAAAYVHALS